MKKTFGVLFNGETASLYTITSGKMTAVFTDLGAALVKLFVPDSEGKLADVVLGFDSPGEYASSCLIDGEDGVLYYDGFTVYTLRYADGTETVYHVD